MEEGTYYIEPECVDFAMSLVNNVSLVGDIVLVPKSTELLEICSILQHLNLRYTDNDMFEILHRNCPVELLDVFRRINTKDLNKN